MLILLASSGMMLLAAARDLMIVFLGIELMSISVYALAGMNRRSERSAEGALKYFLLGAFSTAFLLYGIALVYGATGATGPPRDRRRASSRIDLQTSPILLIGIAMLLVGFGFKVATVPFHMWAPDVYDGSPNPITAYMAATVKTARVRRVPARLARGVPERVRQLASRRRGARHRDDGHRQRDRAAAAQPQAPARLLVDRATPASSSSPSPPDTTQGASAMLFYLLAYTLATFGAFAVIVVLSRGDAPVTIGRSERTLDGASVARRRR